MTHGGVTLTFNTNEDLYEDVLFYVIGLASSRVAPVIADRDRFNRHRWTSFHPEQIINILTELNLEFGDVNNRGETLFSLEIDESLPAARTNPLMRMIRAKHTIYTQLTADHL